MSRVIAQRELRNNNAKIMAAVEAGETFIVTRNGTPVAELRPLTVRKRRFVPKEEFLAMLKATPIDAAAFRRDLDAVIDPYWHDPWDSSTPRS